MVNKHDDDDDEDDDDACIQFVTFGQINPTPTSVILRQFQHRLGLVQTYFPVLETRSVSSTDQLITDNTKFLKKSTTKKQTEFTFNFLIHFNFH